MIRNTNRLPLFRLALTMLTAALVMLAAGYARLRAENRQLAADAQWQRGTVEAVGQTQDAYAAKIAELEQELEWWRHVDETNKLLKQWNTDEKVRARRLEQEVDMLKATNSQLRAENRDMFEGLEMIRKSGKSRKQVAPER